MKRISHIVNPQGPRTEALKRKEERILRQVDQAIAAAEDQAAEAQEQLDSITDSLGSASGAGDTGKLQAAFNKYAQISEEKLAAERCVEHFQALKKALNEEVEVTINPTHVVVESK